MVSVAATVGVPEGMEAQEVREEYQAVAVAVVVVDEGVP